MARQNVPAGNKECAYHSVFVMIHEGPILLGIS